MKYAPGRSAILPLMFLAIVTRLFCEVAVEYPDAHNAGWICPLAGLILYLPFALAAERAASLGNDSAWGNLKGRLPRPLSAVIALLFALLLLLDLSAMVRMTANTASSTIGDKSIVTLEVPLALLAGAMILLGPDAAGHNARLGIYILSALALIMALVQIPSYNAGWIAPVLGGGIRPIVTGSLHCAGYMALLTLPWLVAVPDGGRRGPAFCAAIAALAAAALLLGLQMLSPTFAGAKLLRPARLEIILSNGRVATSLQLLYLVLWYGGFLHLISAEAVTMACLLRHVLPRIRLWIIALGELVAAYLLSGTNFIYTLAGDPAARLLFPAAGVLLVVAMGIAFFAKGGGHSWTKSSESSAR